MQPGGCADYISTHGLVDNDKTQALSIYFRERYPAPTFLSLEAATAASPRTSLNLSLTMDNNDGTVYCGVFESNNSYVPTSVKEILVQNYATSIASDNRAFVSISGLIPATDYDTYCVAISNYGTTTSLNTIERHRHLDGVL